MKNQIQSYIKFWEYACYSDGIPDEVPARIEQLNKAPSYKAIVRAILKNDISLKSIGFVHHKPKAYHELKRIELKNRNKQLQLTLDL